MSARVPSFTVRSCFGPTPSWGWSCWRARRGWTGGSRVPRIQKPGLALAGLRRAGPPRAGADPGVDRARLPAQPAASSGPGAGIEGFLALEPACVIVTKGQDVPDGPARASPTRPRVPILRTPLASSVVIDGVERFMEHALAPTREPARRAGGRAGGGGAAAGQEQRGQVRGGAGAGHARLPAGGRRPGGGAADRRRGAGRVGPRS